MGCEGVVATIRLKALGDAIEDYDYLALLERQGRASEADEIVAPLANSFFAWDKSPAAYEKARSALARLIIAGRDRNQSAGAVNEGSQASFQAALVESCASSAAR